jgi:hypothetical protein
MRYHEIINEDATSNADLDDLFEMANLPKQDTGIDGAIRISTAEAGHAARVKYYAGRPSKSAPSMSVTVTPDPKVVVNSLPEHIASQYEGPVIEWVRANYEALRNFWFNGGEMMRDEVDAMIRSLRKWPIQPQSAPTPTSVRTMAPTRKHGRKSS